MSRWLLALILLSSSTGFAQYYDDDYEDEYYGSPFSPPPPNSQTGQPIPPRPPGGSLPGMAAQELQNSNDSSDSGRMIPSSQGDVKFKIVEGVFWEPKKKKNSSKQ